MHLYRMGWRIGPFTRKFLEGLWKKWTIQKGS